MNLCAHSAVLLSLCVLLQGCIVSKGKDQTPPIPAPVVVQNTVADPELDELLKFVGGFSSKGAAGRLAECKALQKRYRTDRSLQVRLRLLFAQIPTEGCGGVRQGLALANAALRELPDGNLKSLLSYQKQLLARLDRELERRRFSERRIDKTISRTISEEQKKAHRRLKSQESELKELQHKLDALQEIERSLDDPNDGQ